MNHITLEIQQQLEIIKEGVLATVPDTEAIYLFGSYAYGQPHEDSDLDIYVVVPDSVEKNPLDVGVDIRMRLYDTDMHMPMDLMVGKSSSFHYRKEGYTIQKTIAKRGTLIYSLFRAPRYPSDCARQIKTFAPLQHARAQLEQTDKE